jgi:DNA topoisomerase I
MEVRNLLLKQYQQYKNPDVVFCRNFTNSIEACVSKKTCDKWIEPPCVFVGRDKRHPLRGSCKPGVRPCDVVVNTSMLPASPVLKREGFVRFEYHPGKRWKYAWRDPLFRDKRYVYAKSTSDCAKFDIARKLRKKLTFLKTKFDPLLWYFMETLCIRVGNEKDTRVEADTVGCCTLRVHEHVSVFNKDKVRVCFPGKDSVVFDRLITPPPALHQDLLARLRQKKKGQRLFDTASPASINRTIRKVIPGCSAKQIRTMRASVLFERTLLASNDPLLANTNVAGLLNHRRKDNSLLLETSRNNYIDPRIFFAYRKKHPTQKTGSSWFKDAEWAKETQCDFKF